MIRTKEGKEASNTTIDFDKSRFDIGSKKKKQEEDQVQIEDKIESYSMTGKYYYWVVYVGRKPGIYTTWAEAQAQVDGYPNNKHERFKLFDEAQKALCKFHEDSYFGKDIGRSRPEHQASVSASTSVTQLEDQFTVERKANVPTLVLVAIFFLGFVTCILLAHVFDSE